MNRRHFIGGVCAAAASLTFTLDPVRAAQTITNDAFRRVWTRQDYPVQQQLTNRSWTWGPAPISDPVREQYAESPEGMRTVQYFDKSRMEINDPTADPNATWYVTNGLLPIELMTGRLQVGYNQFELRAPARGTRSWCCRAACGRSSARSAAGRWSHTSWR